MKKSKIEMVVEKKTTIGKVKWKSSETEWIM